MKFTYFVNNYFDIKFSNIQSENVYLVHLANTKESPSTNCDQHSAFDFHISFAWNTNHAEYSESNNGWELDFSSVLKK